MYFFFKEDTLCKTECKKDKKGHTKWLKAMGMFIFSPLSSFEWRLKVPDGSNKQLKGSEEKGEVLTWKEVSINLDKVFFGLYVLIVVISYLVIYS